jgi:N-acetylneuraminate synthase
MSVLVVAEAGVNHNGDLETAKALVAAAAEAGADVVKFQTFVAEQITAASAPKARYQLETTGGGESQREMIRRLELSRGDHLALIDECRRHRIAFMSTAFDAGSLDLLLDLGVERIKVASGEITNLPLLRRMGATGKPLFVSTGMSTLDEVAAAIDVLERAGASRDSITVLQCNTAYPTPVADANLRAMRTLADAFGTQVGYSDHTAGIEVAIAAVALGATVIEKHLTLDRTLPGPDHAASLEPDQMRAMIAAIRNIEHALGDGIKRPSPSERENIAIARRSLVATRPIHAGEVFSEGNVAAKRPAGGLSPMRWDEVVGRPAPRDFDTDEPIAP